MCFRWNGSTPFCCGPRGAALPTSPSRPARPPRMLPLPELTGISPTAAASTEDAMGLGSLRSRPVSTHLEKLEASKQKAAGGQTVKPEPEEKSTL